MVDIFFLTAEGRRFGQAAAQRKDSIVGSQAQPPVDFSIRQARAKRIGTQLDACYPDPPIPLAHRDPFTLLIAVLLSAQCTDKKVNEATPGLFAAAADPARMAALPVETIVQHIRHLGLAPTKAKHIQALSLQLLREHQGHVPDSAAALEALPGVGRKTAAVVMSQAFGVPAFPVDTHIHRLAARWGLSTGRSVLQTEKDLKALFAKRTWNQRHLQLIYFGREHCPARGHIPVQCPICCWIGDDEHR